MVDKDVSCAVVFQVGDLQAAGIPYLGRLEGRVERFDFHHCLRISGLDGGRNSLQRFYTSTAFLKIYCQVATLTSLTSCLLKYLSAPSLSDRTNFRLRNWPLSLPRFHRNPSLYPEWREGGELFEGRAALNRL